MLAEIALDSWHGSPLLACFHPSVEQAYPERLQVHRNLVELLSMPGAGAGKSEACAESRNRPDSNHEPMRDVNRRRDRSDLRAKVWQFGVLCKVRRFARPRVANEIFLRVDQ
ncbi:MAG: hypothetical protein DME26_12905 [Verrucomicrobia bacterium]|nr:MAG: hypothetical protein DME26_12905 [Verrucomicrobiota bacterium]